ncbi:MAG TPA: glycoside hydrolase family 43 protein [Chitinophagaceae bacterium]|nr:glycoside hydrolase family 43 protein [Chitinophagaceae bacterium]
MSKWLLFLLTALPFQTIIAQSSDSVYLFSYFKRNGEDGLHLAYSEDGYRWTALKNDSSVLRPTVANDKLMRDPCIIRGAEGLFHMVWTVSWNDKGIGYANSTDLLNWSLQQFIPVMAHEDSARNCWAPEITWDKENQEYLIYWAPTIPGRFAEGDTAGDDRYNHRMYYVTTKDFREFSKAKLLYDKGFNVIDASIVHDGVKYIMFLKDETRYPPQKNIRIATSQHASKEYNLPSKPITGDYWAEGPTAIKKGDEWIVYFDKYRDHKYGAVVSKDLVNWKDISDKIEMPKGIRHGSVLRISRKELAALQ